MTSDAGPEAHLPLKPLTYSILLALAEASDYGYGIAKRVASSTRGGIRLAPSNLYHVLDRLLSKGWIEEAPPADTGDERRTYYALTASGRAVLRAETRRLSAVLATAEGLRLTGEGRG